MRRLIVGIVAVVVVGLLVAVALGAISTPLPDVNDSVDAVGYIDVSAEIPFTAENGLCGEVSSTTGTWPFQTTTTTFECELVRGAFNPVVLEHLNRPAGAATEPASLRIPLSAAPSFTAKVLITAVDGNGFSIGSGWSSEKTFYLGESPRFTWGHIYLDAADQWVTLEFEIWVKGTPRYPAYERLDTTTAGFFFDGVST